MKSALQLDMPAHTDRAAVAEFYQEHGYYIARGVADPTTLAGLRTDFDRSCHRQY